MFLLLICIDKVQFTYRICEGKKGDYLQSIPVNNPIIQSTQTIYRNLSLSKIILLAFYFIFSGNRTKQSLKISPCVSIPPNTNSIVRLSSAFVFSDAPSSTRRSEISNSCRFYFLFCLSRCIKQVPTLLKGGRGCMGGWTYLLVQ